MTYSSARSQAKNAAALSTDQAVQQLADAIIAIADAVEQDIKTMKSDIRRFGEKNQIGFSAASYLFL